MKYNVVIPKPSAKRMDREKKIVVVRSVGWVGGFNDTYTIPADQQGFVFEIPDDYEYFYNRTTLDGSSFRVYVEYSNESGSRTERKELVPEAMA